MLLKLLRAVLAGGKYGLKVVLGVLRKHPRVIAVAVVALVLVWLFMLGGRYSFISLNGGKSNVSELMTVINDTANKFKEVNGEFGYSSDPLSANDCLTGNGFMRSPEILSALSVPETSTIRCVYEIGDGVIRHYSVSVQIGDAVYCTDSRNRKVQTQGFTVTTQCNGK